MVTLLALRWTFYEGLHISSPLTLSAYNLGLCKYYFT